MVLKCSKALKFSLKNGTKVNLEKSCTMTRTYLFPLMFCVFIKSIRSMCNNSSGLGVWILVKLLWDPITCFPFIHFPQIGLLGSLNLETPLIRFLYATLVKSLKLICYNLLFHNFIESKFIFLHINELELGLII